MKTKSFPVFMAICLGLAASAWAVDFYSADFSGWRDKSTSPGFNAVLAKSGKKIKISVPKEVKFGKVMSPEEGISMNVTPNLILQITIDSLDEGSAVSVEATTAAPPYDTHKILNNLTKSGTHNVSLGSAANWSGPKSFWISIWVEGSGKSATISQLRIGENLVELAAPSPAAKKADAAPTPAPKKEPIPDASADYRGDTATAYQYYEDWDGGLNGWRDGNTDKGMNTSAEPKKGKLVLKPKDKAAYGKFMSPKRALEIDFSSFPFLEIELERDLEEGSVKVNLVQAKNPDNFRTVIPQFSRRGVYVANIPEMTGWKGTTPVFVEIWLEGSETQVTFKSIGFARNMGVLEGVMIPVQSVSATELAPNKAPTILKVSGVADQTFRGQWLDGLLAKTMPTSWTTFDRYGKPTIDIGYSEIAQKLYFITSITPSPNVGIYAALGYDLVNNFEGLTWEDPYARAIKAKIDYGLLRFYDFYAGHVAQIGSVYDPLFTDMTFKKASTFRGFLWKPQLGPVNVKLFGTRMATNTQDYKDNIYLLGARGQTTLNMTPGSLRVGLSAVNLAKTNGELDSDLFQGHTDPETYKTFMPSVYVRIYNNSNGIIYYNNQFAVAGNTNINITTGTGTTYLDYGPPAGNNFVYEQSKTYYDAATNGQGIYQGGYVTIRVPLRDDITGNAMDPATLSTVTGRLQTGAWGRPAGSYSGSVDISVSSNNTSFMPVVSQAVNADGATDFSFNMTPSQVASLSQGTFDSTEGTLARSILGVDIRGQLFGVNVDSEFDASLAHNQTYQGKHVTHQANSFFVKLARGFGGALVKAAYFQISRDYSTALDSYNSVDDNDNGSLLPDRYPDKAGVVFGDYSNRGVPDKEFTIGIYVPRDYLFNEGEDRNHNGLLDTRENDHEPDYTYRRDQQGFDVNILVPRQVLAGLLSSNFEIELRGQNITRISKPGRNKTVDLQMSYINTDVDDLTVRGGFYLANIQDDLSDQYEYFTAGEKNLPGSGTPNLGEYQIRVTNQYNHNLIFTPGVMARYNPSWGLDAAAFSRFRLNQPLGSDRPVTHGLAGGVDLRLKYYLLGSFAITPIYQGLFNFEQAAISPIHNTYYIPHGFAVGDDVHKIPMYHRMYLQTSYALMDEYRLAVDGGREFVRHVYPAGTENDFDFYKDRLAIGLLRDLPRGYIRVQYELNKTYFPYNNFYNYGQGVVWAQLTVTF